MSTSFNNMTLTGLIDVIDKLDHKNVGNLIIYLENKGIYKKSSDESLLISEKSFSQTNTDLVEIFNLYQIDLENVEEHGNVNKPRSYSKYYLHKFLKCMQYGFKYQYYTKSKDSDLQPLLKLKSYKHECRNIKEKRRREIINSRFLREDKKMINLGVFETTESFERRHSYVNPCCNL